MQVHTHAEGTNTARTVATKLVSQEQIWCHSVNLELNFLIKVRGQVLLCCTHPTTVSRVCDLRILRAKVSQSFKVTTSSVDTALPPAWKVVEHGTILLWPDSPDRLGHCGLQRWNVTKQPSADGLLDTREKK